MDGAQVRRCFVAAMDHVRQTSTSCMAEVTDALPIVAQIQVVAGIWDENDLQLSWHARPSEFPMVVVASTGTRAASSTLGFPYLYLSSCRTCLWMHLLCRRGLDIQLLSNRFDATIATAEKFPVNIGRQQAGSVCSKDLLPIQHQRGTRFATDRHTCVETAALGLARSSSSQKRTNKPLVVTLILCIRFPKDDTSLGQPMDHGQDGLFSSVSWWDQPGPPSIDHRAVPCIQVHDLASRWSRHNPKLRLCVQSSASSSVAGIRCLESGLQCRPIDAPAARMG